MKKIYCPICQTTWDKGEYVDYRIDSGIGGDGKTPHMIGHIKIQDLIFCPVCFFTQKQVGEYPESSEAKADRVVLKEDKIRIKSIVVTDELGRYVNIPIKNLKNLNNMSLSDFNPFPDAGDGSKGSSQDLRDDFPSAINRQQEAAV